MSKHWFWCRNLSWNGFTLYTLGTGVASSLQACHRHFPEIPTTLTRYKKKNIYSDLHSRFQDTLSDTSTSTYAEQYAKRRYFSKHHSNLKNTFENALLNILSSDDPEVKEKRKCSKKLIFGVNLFLFCSRCRENCSQASSIPTLASINTVISDKVEIWNNINVFIYPVHKFCTWIY